MTILLLPFVLAGCLFPEEFESEVEVNKDGTFSFSYDGILVFVPGVLEEYRRGKLSPQANDDIKSLEKDLKKDSAFKDVEYIGHSRFKVEYEKEGVLEGPFYFPGSDAKIFSILPKDGGIVEVGVMNLSDKDIARLEELDLNIDGELTVETDGEVMEHNADSTPSLFGLIGGYEWEIDSLKDSSPRMVISIK